MGELSLSPDVSWMTPWKSPCGSRSKSLFVDLMTWSKGYPGHKSDVYPVNHFLFCNDIFCLLLCLPYIANVPRHVSYLAPLFNRKPPALLCFFSSCFHFEKMSVIALPLIGTSWPWSLAKKHMQTGSRSQVLVTEAFLIHCLFLSPFCGRTLSGLLSKDVHKLHSCSPHPDFPVFCPRI